MPDEIYRAGFDHRRPFEGDRGTRFQARPGAERVLAAYEASLVRRQRARGDGPGRSG
ncbi:MAG TPA: hypothetical protein VKY91_09025 [Vulgatibacteraceae bacterium]|nr:hypothetical protein [Vulgatibacteraceae bacterium]